MSDNANLIENAKLDIAPVKDFLELNQTEITTLSKRLNELRSELYKLYNGHVEGAVGELQELAHEYDEDEAEKILWSLEENVNKLGLGIGQDGGYLWVPSTRSC